MRSTAKVTHAVAVGLLIGCERARPETAATSGDTTLMRAESAATPAASPAPSVAPLPTLRFEDYAVSDTALRRARPAPVDLASAAYGRMYRTKLREAAAAGPNFAGHFTLALWGCGTGCQIVAVIDARTGRLSRQTLLTANGVEFRRDSRLLLADPRTPEIPPECASCGTPAYYEWRNARFEPVEPGLHLHLGGQRPWQAECAPSDTGLAARTGPYTCPR
jgi:hypothetical protein